MRAQFHFPRAAREWLPGLLASVPLTLVLLSTREPQSQWSACAAGVAVLLAIPWVVPATMLLAVLSAPIYMWLHSQGPVPAVLDWLGAVVLVAAVVGCHVNVALLFAWQRVRRSNTDEMGLSDFLLGHGQRK